MNNELQQHKKSDTVKWILTLIAFILVGVLLLGVILGWFEKKEPVKEAQFGGGMEVAEVQSNGVSLLSARIAVEDYEEYGISPLAENAYTLTATVTPADAENKKVDWTIAFKNASSSWATGKTVTDYVTVTPSADGSLTAVVENVAAFGEQIIVKCTSCDNTSAFATCAVEYLQRTNGYQFYMDGSMYDTNGMKTHAVTPTFATTKTASTYITVDKSSVYTRANTDSATYFTMKPTAALKTAITNAGLPASGLKEYSGSNNATVSGFFDSTWGRALYTNNAQKNTLIAALQHFSGVAYEIVIYESNGGEQLAIFNISLNTSVISGQKGVEGLSTDKSEIVF